MRLILALPFLILAGCDVDRDQANEQMTLHYNGQRIEDAAADAARTTGNVASAVGNVAVSTGRAVGDEIGDIDVDVDVTRNRSSAGTANQAAAN